MLTPELSVRDWQTSVAFYQKVLGFSVRYQRPEEGFAFLERDGAGIMLDQIGVGRDFDPDVQQVVGPLGRGINLQIRVDNLAELLAAIMCAGLSLTLPEEVRWYRRGDVEVGNRQFVIADPDGYLLRFYEDLGERSV